MVINTIIQRYKEIQLEEKNLSDNIINHFTPIIEEMIETKNINGLKNLLDIIPDCICKVSVYQGIRNLSNI